MTDLISELFESGLFADIEKALLAGRKINLSNVQSGLEGFLAVEDTPSRHWRLLEGCLDMIFPNSLEKAVLLRH